MTGMIKKNGEIIIFHGRDGIGIIIEIDLRQITMPGFIVIESCCVFDILKIEWHIAILMQKLSNPSTNICDKITLNKRKMFGRNHPMHVVKTLFQPPT